MAVNRWDPFTVLARLDDDFDALVRRTWGSAGPASGRRAGAGYVPPIEMATDGADVVVTLELPGVDVERDVDVEVRDGRLVISGERREQHEAATSDEQGNRKVLVREMRYGSFRREFELPDGVGADDVEATYDMGLLQVRVHNVTRPVEQPRKVAIRGASSHKTIEATPEAQADTPTGS